MQYCDVIALDLTLFLLGVCYGCHCHTIMCFFCHTEMQYCDVIATDITLFLLGVANGALTIIVLTSYQSFILMPLSLCFTRHL